MKKRVFRTSLLLILFGLLSYNLYPRPQSKFEVVKNQVLASQNNPNTKIELARMYLENNDWQMAEKITNNLKNEIDFQKNEPERIKNEINKWEEISKKYPNFRDAELKLALLNWQIYNGDLARWHQQKALELDQMGPQLELQ